MAVIVVPSSDRFASEWGLQRLWCHLAAGLLWDWDGSDCIAIYIATGLHWDWDGSDCGAI